MSNRELTLCEAAARLKACDGVLVLTHKRPDGDTVGCASALVQGLRALGKTAYAAVNPELTPRYAPYLEPYYPPEGFVPDTVIAVDVAAESLLPEPLRKYAAQTALALDHHAAGRCFAREICTEPARAACGELIYTLLGLLEVPITGEIADALYAAVSTDTGCFRYSNTSADTHRIAAALMEAGCHAAALNQKLVEEHTPARVAIEAAVMRDLRYYAGGEIALVRVSRALVTQTGATEDDMENLSSLPRCIEGVRVGITLYERDEGIKVSVRTDASADAARVCAEVGGGGHPRAAGATLTDCTMEEAAQRMLDAVRQHVEALRWEE